MSISGKALENSNSRGLFFFWIETQEFTTQKKKKKKKKNPKPGTACAEAAPKEREMDICRVPIYYLSMSIKSISSAQKKKKNKENY